MHELKGIRISWLICLKSDARIEHSHFDAEQFSKRRMHFPILGFPPLPGAARRMHQGCGLGLSESCAYAGGVNFFGRGVAVEHSELYE